MINIEIVFMLHNKGIYLSSIGLLLIRFVSEKLIQVLNPYVLVKIIQKCFLINTTIIYRLRKLQKQSEMIGSVEDRTFLCGRKRFLSEDDIAHIDNLIHEPDIKINQIMDALHLKVSDESIRKASLKLDMFIAKNPFMPRNRSVHDIRFKRANWQ